MGFLTNAVLKVNDDDAGFTLLAPLAYEGNTERFVVPPGFRTDLASVPHSITWLLPRYGGGVTRCAILHDFLCRTQQLSQHDVDGLFYRSLREAGVSRLRAELLWAGVALAHKPVREDWGRLALTFPLALLLLLPVPLVWLWQRAFRLLEGTS